MSTVRAHEYMNDCGLWQLPRELLREVNPFETVFLNVNLSDYL